MRFGFELCLGFCWVLGVVRFLFIGCGLGRKPVIEMDSEGCFLGDL